MTHNIFWSHIKPPAFRHSCCTGSHDNDICLWHCTSGLHEQQRWVSIKERCEAAHVETTTIDRSISIRWLLCHEDLAWPLKTTKKGQLLLFRSLIWQDWEDLSFYSLMTYHVVNTLNQDQPSDIQTFKLPHCNLYYLIYPLLCLFSMHWPDCVLEAVLHWSFVWYCRTMVLTKT